MLKRKEVSLGIRRGFLLLKRFHPAGHEHVIDAVGFSA